MSKKIQLSIHEPCHENWDKMTPVQKGRFCGSCQKQVVDFSNMSDRQMAEFFKKPTTGSVCGRFMVDQLDRDIDIPKKRIPWFKYFFTIALPAMFVAKAGAQKMGKVLAPHTQTDTTTRPVINDVMGKISPSIQPVCNTDTVEPMIKGEISYTPLYREVTLKGRILDENGRPIEGASVTVKNTNNGVASGNHGKYTINVKPGDVLSVSALGYLTTEITVTSKKNMDIRMEKMSEPVIVAGMISIDWKQQRPDPVVVMEEISDSAAAKTIIDLIDSDSQSGFRVFPNPVVSGQYLSMQCSKIENGNYTLQWLDQSGRFIREESVQAASKNNLIRSYVPSVPAGSYFLVLSNKKSGKKFAQKIIVQ